MTKFNRRDFIRHIGLSAAALPFVSGLPSLGAAPTDTQKKRRLVVMFTPNGQVPESFWPDEEGADFKLKEILSPLEAYRDRMLVLKGIDNKVRGDGDSHMRGMSCLLTGIELFPGNIQGGSHTPAGWASGISIDQELKNFLQSNEATKTRFGALEFGVEVDDRADPWTRMSYAGPNKPVAPVSDPYLMLEKIYGSMADRDTLKSILDDVQMDLKKVYKLVSPEDRAMLQEHETLVREMELEMQVDPNRDYAVEPIAFEPGVDAKNDNMPKLSRMQIDLLVNSFQNDMARVATLQYTKSVGNARMTWLGIDQGHHTLSHDPDKDEESQKKLVQINKWFAGELNYFVDKLAKTPEPGAEGSMLDNTTIVWTNELGKGNSHTLNDIPFVLVGGGLGFKTGRSLKLKDEAHNRLHLALANGMGHEIKTFGKPELCEKGPLALS